MDNTKISTYEFLKDTLDLKNNPTALDLIKIINILNKTKDTTWLYGGDTYEEKVELKHLKFKNLSIQKLNLSNFDFSESTFENVKFEDCILVRSRFDKVKMKNCSFERCDMTFSQITYADFENTLFKNLKLYNIYIKWLKLKNCNWELLIFKGGLLGNTNFSDCIWQDVHFLGGEEFTGLTFPKGFNIL